MTILFTLILMIHLLPHKIRPLLLLLLFSIPLFLLLLLVIHLTLLPLFLPSPSQILLLRSPSQNLAAQDSPTSSLLGSHDPPISPNLSLSLFLFLRLIGAWKTGENHFFSILLCDYVTNAAATTSPSPSVSSPSPPLGTHPIAHYINCTNFSVKYQKFIVALVSINDPHSFKEAMKNPDWQASMQDEIQALELS